MHYCLEPRENNMAWIYLVSPALPPIEYAAYHREHISPSAPFAVKRIFDMPQMESLCIRSNILIAEKRLIPGCKHFIAWTTTAHRIAEIILQSWGQFDKPLRMGFEDFQAIYPYCMGKVAIDD